MQNENHQGHRLNLQGSGGAIVTPHNSTNLERPAQGFRLENVANGNVLTMVFMDDTTLQLTLTEADAGYHPFVGIKRFNATGTTGTLRIIAIF